jgi:uncharacterized protein with von Willebrand factor type A (vWA) domain
MRTVTLRYINELRAAGLRISLSESMDAVQAVAAVGIEREVLREALAASLVKEEEDRPVFDEIFVRFFAGPGPRHKGKHQEQLSGGEGQHTKENGLQAREQEPPSEQRQTGKRSAQQQLEQSSKQERQEKARDLEEQTAEHRGKEEKDEKLPPHPSIPHSSSHRALLEKPFKEFGTQEVDPANALVEELSRRLRGCLSRRYKRRKRGRLDFRRTIRASISHGGVPIELLLRGRRPGKPDLVALCDLSGSVAVVSDFLLALLAPAAEYFRRVHTFAYVDRLCQVSFERGYVVPHATLDLYARSDFGKVLQQFWQDLGENILSRNTIVLILGDARNNRRPPRPALLARIHDRAKKLIWLNPEPRERWNTGDSVIGLYTPVCDVVLGCGNLRELLNALKQAF